MSDKTTLPLTDQSCGSTLLQRSRSEPSNPSDVNVGEPVGSDTPTAAERVKWWRSSERRPSFAFSCPSDHPSASVVVPPSRTMSTMYPVVLKNTSTRFVNPKRTVRSGRSTLWCREAPSLNSANEMPDST